MPAPCHRPRALVSSAATVVAVLVLAGCGGPAEIAPAKPSAEEVRETQQALEAAAAAEKPAAKPVGR